MHAVLKISSALMLSFIIATCGVGIEPPSGQDSPTVTGASAADNGNGTVTVSISGSGFIPGQTTVTVDGYNCTPVTVISSTQLTCILDSSVSLTNIVVSTSGDGSSGGGSSGGGSDTTPHRVFITSFTYDGNLGSLSGADNKCLSTAMLGTKTSGLAGTWRAILSTTGTSAASRILLRSGVDILNTNGETVISSTNLWSATSLSNKIKYNQNGTACVLCNTWTGTLVGGGEATNNCANWTSNGLIQGQYGDGLWTNTDWISKSTGICNVPMNLYCINAKE